MLWLVAAVNAAVTPASAYFNDYFPDSVAKHFRVAPQSTLLEEIKTDQHVDLDRIAVSNDDKGFVVSGKTKSGKNWTLKMDPVGLGGSIIKCDFDANGIDDWIIMASTGGCGLAPPRYMTFLMFDTDLLPHAAQVVAYSYQDDTKPVEDIVMLPGRKAPVMVQQDMCWVTGQKRDRTYWRWHFYGAKNYKLAPADGIVGGVKFPTFVWYTFKPNHKISAMASELEKITRSQHDTIQDLQVSVDSHPAK